MTQSSSCPEFTVRVDYGVTKCMSQAEFDWYKSQRSDELPVYAAGMLLLLLLGLGFGIVWLLVQAVIDIRLVRAQRKATRRRESDDPLA